MVRFAGDRHDAYSARALGRVYEEFLGRRRTTVAPIAFSVDGKNFPDFYALLAEAPEAYDSGELRIDPPAPDGPAWQFLRPFDRIVLRRDGSAELHRGPSGAPTRVIVRFLLREHYLPRSRAEEDRAAGGGARVELGGFIGTLGQSLGACRQRALLPFSVAVLLYFPDERIRYELDLVRSALLSDPRAGRLSPSRRLRRTARVGWGVDRAVGRGDLPLFAARCLEVLSESPGLTAIELAHVLGGVRELVDSALQGLVARQLVTFDRRTGVYRPRLEAFVPLPAGSVETGMSADVAPNPALRTSVQELIAAAEARATCPLCGSPLPSGHRGILCDKCAAEVAAG